VGRGEPGHPVLAARRNRAPGDVVQAPFKTLLFLSGSIMPIAGTVQACTRGSNAVDTSSSGIGYVALPILGAFLIGVCWRWRPWSLASEQDAHELAAHVGIPKDALDAWLLEKRHARG
jgi:hypothetical protein